MSEELYHPMGICGSSSSSYSDIKQVHIKRMFTMNLISPPPTRGVQARIWFDIGAALLFHIPNSKSSMLSTGIFEFLVPWHPLRYLIDSMSFHT